MVGANELEDMWETAAMAYLKYQTGICLEGLRKTTSDENSWNLNAGPPE
jgi:hypothetical protein